ncbi:hypothetical protein HOY82DRAFT_574899 [Tuber indicum]|nr:hypothetical protein HOY82DRAFT_574899 [Tuber indicum]
MAQAWSQSAASLESIYAIPVLSIHDHPFVLVGKYALKWMGVPVHTGYLTLPWQLVRTSQVGSICKALAQTGERLEVYEPSIPELPMLSELPEHRSRGCLSYNLTVDAEKVQVPHPINFVPALMESQFHPNPTDRRAKPYPTPYPITDENLKFVWGEPVAFPMDDDRCRIPQMDMDYSPRYLILDLLSQQDKLLSKVQNTKRLAEYFADWRRRAKYGADSRPWLQVPFIMLSL